MIIDCGIFVEVIFIGNKVCEIVKCRIKCVMCVNVGGNIDVVILNDNFNVVEFIVVYCCVKIIYFIYSG